MSNIQEIFFIWSDNMSDDFEQIRHFAKSSAMSDGPMAFSENWIFYFCWFEFRLLSDRLPDTRG